MYTLTDSTQKMDSELTGWRGSMREKPFLAWPWLALSDGDSPMVPHALRCKTRGLLLRSFEHVRQNHRKF